MAVREGKNKGMEKTMEQTTQFIRYNRHFKLLAPELEI
jgi:hypothetical protein